jgi:hypothetical protein
LASSALFLELKKLGILVGCHIYRNPGGYPTAVLFGFYPFTRL